jgi:hypothetical protein
VSVVAAVSLACQGLSPLFLTITDVPHKDAELQLLREQFTNFQTARGYLTIPAMKVYTATSLGPYCDRLRMEFQENVPVFLIVDSHPIHDNPDILAGLAEINVHPIWLPAHSTHFLQPLDLRVFAPFNAHSCNLRSRPTQPKIEGKLIRALHAWHEATWCACIYQGWMAGGIEVRRPLSPEAPAVINAWKVSKILKANCPDEEDTE